MPDHVRPSWPGWPMPRSRRCCMMRRGPALAAISGHSSIQGIVFDTALAAYIAAPGQRSFALEDIVQRILGREREIGASGEQLSFDDTGSYEGLVEQSAEIIDLTAALTTVLEAEDALKVLEGIELPLSMSLPAWSMSASLST